LRATIAGVDKTGWRRAKAAAAMVREEENIVLTDEV
jgi:hypothetical protein